MVVLELELAWFVCGSVANFPPSCSWGYRSSISSKRSQWSSWKMTEAEMEDVSPFLWEGSGRRRVSVVGF